MLAVHAILRVADMLPSTNASSSVECTCPSGLMGCDGLKLDDA